MARDLIKQLPKYYRGSAVMALILATDEAALSAAEAVINDTDNQCLVGTASSALSRWESIFGIPNSEDPDERRRERILAKKRGGGTVTLSLEELGDCIPDNSTFPDTLEARALAQIITRFLYTLPEQQRLIFLRRYWYCDSVAQVANHCNCSESKVKMSLLRSRNKLLEYLKKEGVFIERP